MTIDLILFTAIPSDPIVWEHGKVCDISFSSRTLIQDINAALKAASADWVLVWYTASGVPDIDLIKRLTEKQVDVWHAGIKAGLGGQPDILNYVHPTWMYNKDASDKTEHTSFRLSIRCCLIRSSILRVIGYLSEYYTTVDAAGLAWGYRMLKQGAVIRYTPELIRLSTSANAISVKDNWVFAREFFSTKWHYWCLWNMPRRKENYQAFLKTADVKPYSVVPAIYPSQKTTVITKPATVSVLAPTLNRYSYLEAELEQLSAQTIMPLEVLITDQTDAKDRQPIQTTKYPSLNVRCFIQEEKGQCVAWNKLLDEAKGDYVLFLGDDADDIKPDFIEKLLQTMQRFDCDMVASNVIEFNAPERKLPEFYSLTDIFPITLIKRSLLLQTGFMDMFYNKNIRADQDLAMRCHLAGALMIFDPSAKIFHHHAPVGGLRAHKARVVTSGMAKKSIGNFLNPTSSEIYLANKYFEPRQVRNYIRIKYLNQLFIKGNIFRKLLRTGVFIFKLPALLKQLRANETLALIALAQSAEGKNSS